MLIFALSLLSVSFADPSADGYVYGSEVAVGNDILRRYNCDLDKVPVTIRIIAYQPSTDIWLSKERTVVADQRGNDERLSRAEEAHMIAAGHINHDDYFDTVSADFDRPDRWDYREDYYLGVYAHPITAVCVDYGDATYTQKYAAPPQWTHRVGTSIDADLPHHLDFWWPNLEWVAVD